MAYFTQQVNRTQVNIFYFEVNKYYQSAYKLICFVHKHLLGELLSRIF